MLQKVWEKTKKWGSYNPARNENDQKKLHDLEVVVVYTSATFNFSLFKAWVTVNAFGGLFMSFFIL